MRFRKLKWMSFCRCIVGFFNVKLKLQCKWLSFLQVTCMEIPLILYSIYSKAVIYRSAICFLQIISLSTSSISSPKCHFSKYHTQPNTNLYYTERTFSSLILRFRSSSFSSSKAIFAFIEALDVIWRCFYIAFWIVRELFFAFNTDFGTKRQLCAAFHKKKCKT